MQNDRLDMRLNLTRLRTSGAARRSALRAPSALRAAARRSFVTNMKIEPKIVFDIKTLAKNRLRRAMWLLISHLILYPPLSAPTPDLSRDTNLSAASFRGRGPPRIRLGDEVPPASLLFPAALRA